MTTISPDTRVIVVGVDGSPGSLRALRWAIGESRLRGSAVEAVTTWRPGSTGNANTPEAAKLLQSKAIRDATAALDAVPLIAEEIEAGAPEEVLVRRSEHASLLVIGSHGVGSIRHAALGSTSEYCSRMASCPVVVLPMPAGEAIAGELTTTTR